MFIFDVLKLFLNYAVTYRKNASVETIHYIKI